MTFALDKGFWDEPDVAVRRRVNVSRVFEVAPDAGSFLATLDNSEFNVLNRPDIFTPILPQEGDYSGRTGFSDIDNLPLPRNQLLVKLDREDRNELRRNISLYGPCIDYNSDDHLAASRAFRRCFPSGNELTKKITSNFLRTSRKYDFPELMKKGRSVFAGISRRPYLAQFTRANHYPPSIKDIGDGFNVYYTDEGGHDEDGFQMDPSVVNRARELYDKGKTVVMRWDLHVPCPMNIIGKKKMRPHNNEVVLVLDPNGKPYDPQEDKELQRHTNELRDEMILNGQYPYVAPEFDLTVNRMNTRFVPRGIKPRNRLVLPSKNENAQKKFLKMCMDKHPPQKDFIYRKTHAHPPFAFKDLNVPDMDPIDFFYSLLRDYGKKGKNRVQYDEEMGLYVL